MRLSLAFLPLALIGNADRSYPAQCANMLDDVSNGAVLPASGRIAIKDAVIDVHEADDVLELTVRDGRSGAVTILELPRVPSP